MNKITILLGVEGLGEAIGKLWCREAIGEEIENFKNEVFELQGVDVDRLVYDHTGRKYYFVTVTEGAPEKVMKKAKENIRVVSLVS